MTERIIMITMAGLGIGLSTVTSSTVSPGLAKGLSWLISGIALKFLK